MVPPASQMSAVSAGEVHGRDAMAVRIRAGPGSNGHTHWA